MGIKYVNISINMIMLAIKARLEFVCAWGEEDEK